MSLASGVDNRHTIINKREKTWYPEPYRESLLTELHRLATDPPRHRQRSIAIIAGFNGGKSVLAAQYLARHPIRTTADGQHIPAILLKMTKLSRVEDFSVALLKAIGAPDPSGGTHTARVERFTELARRVKLGLVFLDEFHDCADTTGRGKPFLRVIKGLMNDGLLVVPMGVEELAQVLADDGQLSSRFNFSRGRLPQLTDASTVKSLMMHISGLNEDQITDPAVRYVQHETQGTLGLILDFVEETMIHQSSLSLEALKKHRLFMDSLNEL